MAATIPPSKLVLLPTMAFCTLLLMSKTKTKSITDNCDNSFLPKNLIANTIKIYTATDRKAMSK